MGRGNFVGEVTVWFGLELVHDYAQDASTLFPGAATGGLHYAQVAAGANRVTSFSQQLAGAMCLGVFRVGLGTASAAKDGNDSFLCLAHTGMLPLIISEPAARYSTKSSRL